MRMLNNKITPSSKEDLLSTPTSVIIKVSPKNKAPCRSQFHYFSCSWMTKNSCAADSTRLQSLAPRAAVSIRQTEPGVGSEHAPYQRQTGFDWADSDWSNPSCHHPCSVWRPCAESTASGARSRSNTYPPICLTANLWECAQSPIMTS